MKILEKIDNFIRNTNLELLQRYGPSVWKDYITCLEKEKEILDKENSSIKFEINEINAKRKFAQVFFKRKFVNKMNN